MTTLTFITSGVIDYTLPGKSLYESIRATSLGKEFPGLVRGAEEEVKQKAQRLVKPDIIVTAPSNQSLETALIFTDYFKVKYKKDKRLLPLKFDIRDFIHEYEFNKLGKMAFDKLRKDFINAFFENILLENNQEISKRFEALVEEHNGKRVLLVSHAFIIKLFQIYNLIGDDMFTDKNKLVKLFNPNKPPLGRLEVVVVNI